MVLSDLTYRSLAFLSFVLVRLTNNLRIWIQHKDLVRGLTVLTYGCVSNESLFVSHDGVDGHLLEVVRRDDSDRRVECSLG